jgi:hypothetical protein
MRLDELVPDGPLPKLWGFNAMRVRYPKMGAEIPKGKDAVEYLRNMSFEETAWSPTLVKTSHVPYRFGQLYLQGGKKEDDILKRLASRKSLKPTGPFPVTVKNINRIFGGPSVLVPMVSKPPVIDGTLDDPVWKSAEPLTFASSDGGKAIAHNTIAKMVTDAKNLYLSFKCNEKEMDFLVADNTADDASYWGEDSLEIWLDVHHTEKVDFYYFGVNAIGSVMHCRNGFDRDWDPKGMKTKVGYAKDHWVVELKIPFADLFKDPRNVTALWGVNFNRCRPAKFDRRFEDSAWAPTRMGTAHVPERFGHAYFQAGKLVPKEVREFIKIRDSLVK